MSSTIKNIVNFLINGNILIATAAVAQCILTYVILQKPINANVVSIEGASTMILYQVSLYLSKPANPASSPFLRTRWFFSNIWYFWLSVFVAAVVLVYCLLQLHPWTCFYLGVIGILSLGYGLPIFSFEGRKVGLRQVPGLKVFYIAILWSLSGAGLPVVEMWAEGEGIDWGAAHYLGISKVLFLLVCTLPFDIRDMRQDALYHLKTIPLILGERKSRSLCYLILFIHTLLLIFAPYDWVIILGLLLTNVIVLALLKFVIFTTKSGYSAVYWLDFVLLIQCVIVLIVYFPFIKF